MILCSKLTQAGNFRVQFCGFLKKLYPQGRSQTSVHQIANSEARLHLLIHVQYMHNISLKHGSTFNTRNDFILNVWCHVSRKIASGVAVRGDSGVAGEGRVVRVPKFHSWGKCTVPLTNINSDWMSNTSSGHPSPKTNFTTTETGRDIRFVRWGDLWCSCFLNETLGSRG